MGQTRRGLHPLCTARWYPNGGRGLLIYHEHEHLSTRRADPLTTNEIWPAQRYHPGPHTRPSHPPTLVTLATMRQLQARICHYRRRGHPPPINTVAVALRRRLGPPSRVIGVVPSDGQRCSRGACGAGYSVFKGRWLANDCLLLIEIACDHHWRATPGGTVAVVPVR